MRLADFVDYISERKDAVYSKICDYVQIKDPVQHYRMVREYTDRKGNYRRPGLLMLSGQIFGASMDDLVVPAAAMQLSEDWILIHDDVEDHSEMRRGKPTLHVIYGDELAINAGDAAHIAMWKMLQDYTYGAKHGNEVYDKFYHMIEHTLEGQYKDTDFVRNIRSMGKSSERFYFDVIESKTCYYTVYGPMQIGAIVAGQGRKTLDMLERVGRPAGRAFQIMDDILDMTADEKTFGKKRYGDIYEGKATLMVIHAYGQAGAGEKEMVDRVYSKRWNEKTPDDIANVVGIIEKYGGIEYAKSVAKSNGQEAKDALKESISVFPQNDYTGIMSEAIEGLYNRIK